ncbi:MAG: SDR family oxidoreductase [Ruminococcaceae bacterium]|nr:SDR family oxidoreductase [Oscillospiraceae bacterium]
MLKCFDLTGKVALVTGGSQGLGKAMALALAKSGANICIVSRTASKLEKAAEEIRACGVECIWATADVTSDEDISAAVKKTVDTFGKLDILIANAAHPGIFKNTEDMTTAEWDEVMKHNIDGMFISCREAAKVMLPNGSGKIIIIASIASEIFNAASIPNAYETSKGAVRSMVKALDASWGKRGINVNGIAPGYFRSDVIEERVQKDPAYLDYLNSLVPCGRAAMPEEIGPAAVLLASDGASYIHGEILTVDGGRSYL